MAGAAQLRDAISLPVLQPLVNLMRLKHGNTATLGCMMYAFHLYCVVPHNDMHAS